MKKALLLVIPLLIVSYFGYRLIKVTGGTNPQPTQKEVFIEKWNKVGILKYDELEYNKKAQEAKTAKDKLLEELNGTGNSFQN